MGRILRHQSDLTKIRRDDPNFAGTLSKGLMILQVFQKDPRPWANSELAARLGLSRPTVSRLCRTLLDLGYLDHDRRSDRYFIGPAAVTLGYPYVVTIPLRAVARPAMQALANQVKGAASIGVAMDLDVAYVETCAWQRGTLARPDVGATRGIAETAMGRAWLASLGPAERAEAMKRLRRERPEEVARCEAGIRVSLQASAQRGFAVNFGDAGLGIQAVAVASRITQVSRVLLFNCSLPGSRVSREDLLESIGPRLLELVRRCERELGLNIY